MLRDNISAGVMRKLNNMLLFCFVYLMLVSMFINFNHIGPLLQLKHYV